MEDQAKPEAAQLRALPDLHGRLDRWPELSLDERCALLANLVGALFEPDDDVPGYRESALVGCYAPPALRAVFLAGGRTLARGQDRLVPPASPTGDRHRVVVENQGCFAIRAHVSSEADPWVDWIGEHTEARFARLSDVLLGFVIAEAGVALPVSAMGWPSSAAIAELASRVRPVPIRAWPWPGPGPRECVHGSGIFGVRLEDAKFGAWVWVGARDRAAFEFLRPFGRKRWDAWPFDDD